MKVLEGTKLILQYMDLYTRPPVTFCGIDFPSKYIKHFVFFSMILTTIPLAAFCYVNINNFKVASVGILFLMANTSIKVIYLVLTFKREHIIDSINHLEELIKWRKKLASVNLSIFNKFFSQTGTEINSNAMDLYEERENGNNRLAKNLLRSGIYTIMIFLLPNAYPPITNRLFGWPKTVLWNFPFPVV